MKFSLPSLIQFYAIAALIYIALGDVFLPHPYNTNSQEVRSSINEYIIGLFPDHRLHSLPKSHSNVNVEINTLDSVKLAQPGSKNSPF